MTSASQTTKLKIAVLPGDGIGPEVIGEAVRVLRAVSEFSGREFEFAECAIGGAAIRASGNPLPADTLETCLSSDAVLLGAVGSSEFDVQPPDRRPEAGLLQLRRALGCYANLRPAVAYRGTAGSSPLRPEVTQGADLLIVRELLGGLYFGEPRGRERDGGDAGAPGEPGWESAFNTLRYSTPEIERVAHVAFEQARTRRRRVTSVDKANVLETSRLWREVVTRVARNYPDVRLEHMYVDACAMHLVSHPRNFDVILTENLFGDILSDEAAVITGSLGMLGSASLGGRVGLYEPVHGSAPDLAGKDVANPIGAIHAAAMLLHYSAGLEQAVWDIEAAVRAVLDAGQVTADLAAGGRTPEAGGRKHEAGPSGRAEPTPAGAPMAPGFGAMGREAVRRVVTTAQMGALIQQRLTDFLDQHHAYHAV